MKYSDSQRQTDRSFCKSQTGPAFGLDRDKYNNYRALPDNAFTAESDRVSSFAMPLSRMTPSLIALCGKNPVQYPPRQTSYPLGSPKNRLDDHLSEDFASARLHISLTHNALKISTMQTLPQNAPKCPNQGGVCIPHFHKPLTTRYLHSTTNVNLPQTSSWGNG